MPGGWQVGSAWGSPQNFGSVLSGSTGLSGVTSGSPANTKGSWTQTAAATTSDVEWVILQVVKPYGGSTSYAIDIGIGASGSEVAIASNLILQGAQQPGVTYVLPLAIKAGTRIAIRCQSDGASSPCYYAMLLMNDCAFSGAGGSAIDTYGFNAATSYGTALDPGTAGNAKGAYSQLVAATTANLDGFLLGFDAQGRNSGSANTDYFFDIAIGAAGSESVILPNFWNYLTGNGQQLLFPNSFYLPIPIAAGSRISARCQSGNTGTDRAIGLTLYGIRQ
jgi:hypothetical protein